MSDVSGIPPGWYPDPAGSPHSRWWDGRGWTTHLSEPPASSSQPSQPSEPSQPSSTPPTPSRAPLLVAIGAGVVVVLIIGVLAVTILGHRSTRVTNASVTHPDLPTTAAPTTITPPTTTTPRAPTTPTTTKPLVSSGLNYVDPAGVYEMTMGPGWTTKTSPISGAVVWSVGTTSAGFADNINVVVENLPADISLGSYADAAASRLNTVTKITIVSQKPVTLDDGTAAVAIRLANSSVAGVVFAQDSLITVKGRRAVIVTTSAGNNQGLVAPAILARSIHFF